MNGLPESDQGGRPAHLCSKDNGPKNGARNSQIATGNEERQLQSESKKLSANKKLTKKDNTRLIRNE